MKRAIWLPNWIGDAVMATPALRMIREAYPNDHLTGIYTPPIAATLAGTDLLDVMIQDHSGKGTSLGKKYAFASHLRRHGFEEILLLTNSLRTAAVARMARIRRRVGFNRDGRGCLLTERLQPKSKTAPNPVIDEYLRLAAQFTGKSLPARPDYHLHLGTSSEDEQQWEDFAAEHQLTAGSYYCLNSGGAFGASKHWPLDHFAKLARQLVDSQQLPVVMLCGPAEQQLARDFVKAANHPLIHSLAEEKLSVGFSKAMVKHSSLMVTTDSGPRHFAAAFGVPVVTLFGPTHIEWSESFFPHAVHLQEQMDCGPCQQRSCPLGHLRCMHELSVNRVFNAVLKLQQQELRFFGDRESAA